MQKICCIRVGHGSTRFRYPDPRPLLNKIVLHDPVQLQRDFANVSVTEIIDFLAEAGKAMTLNHSRMERAYKFSLPFSALTPSIVKGSYELIPVVFSKMALRTMVENEIGSKYLDGWVVFEPASVGTPAMSNRFFTANGTPASGPAGSPEAHAASTAAAFARARSAVMAVKEFSARRARRCARARPRPRPSPLFPTRQPPWLFRWPWPNHPCVMP